MRPIDRIYIHCSYSSYGDVDLIRSWHLAKGWKDIGYHFVVMNQFPTYNDYEKHAKAIAADNGKLADHLYSSRTDGEIRIGRPIEMVGAHVLDDNDTSIGVVYVGVSPSAAQYSALLTHTRYLQKKYVIPTTMVFGHYEFWTTKGLPPEKTCPNMNMDTFRNHLNLLA